MPEAGSSKSEGILTKIIVGVATPVLTALALYYFGIGGGGEKKTTQNASVPTAVQSVQPVNDSDLRAKQAELERKIEELSQSKKERSDSPPTGRERCATDGWILNFTPSH